jgi:hypothetical protein
MPQLDQQLPAFQLTSPQGDRIAVDDLVQGGPVVLAAIEADGAGDPRAEMLEDVRERLGAGRIYDPAVVAALAAEVAPDAPAA